MKYFVLQTFLFAGIISLTALAQTPPPPPEVKWLEDPKLVGKDIQLKWMVVVPPGYEIVKDKSYVQQNGKNIAIPDTTRETMVPALVGKNRMRIQVRMRPIGPPPGPEVDYQTPPKDVIYLP